MKYILGVDPGQSGYLSLLPVRENGDLVKDKVVSYPIPNIVTDGKKEIDVLGLHNLLVDLNSKNCSLVVVEDQWARPGHNINSTFKLGTNWGILNTLLRVNKYYKIAYVSPTTWQAAVRKPVMELLSDCGKEKEASIAVAKHLFPQAPIGKNHDMADSLLIGYYGYIKQIEG